MDSSFSPKDEIWFLLVCHHISTGLYTELFSAILISRIIFSCMFDIKCHNEIKCSMVVGNLFHLRLSSTITFKSLYFKLTRCVQLPFQLTCSLNPIRSSRVDSSVKVRKFSNVPGSSVPEMLDNFTPWCGCLPEKILLNPVATKTSNTMFVKFWKFVTYGRESARAHTYTHSCLVNNTVAGDQWRTKGGLGGSNPPPRNSEVLTKSNRTANWAGKCLVFLFQHPN